MEVNITTVTATRLWSKTLSRLYPKIKEVENKIQSLDLTDDCCEVLQIIFHDESNEIISNDGFVKVNRKRQGDRIAQVIMTVPSGFSFKRDGSEDESIYKSILQRTLTGINKSHLKDDNKRLIEEVIKKFI